MTRERGWLVSTEQLILSTWLLKSFSAKVTFWSALKHGTQILSWFFPFREVYPHRFPIMFLPSPWPSDHSPWTGIESFNRPFLLLSKMKNQMHDLRFYPLGGLPFTTVLKECPRKIRTAAAYFGEEPACPVEPSLNLASFLILSWSQRISHEAIGRGWQREGKSTGTGTMDIWATSCNFCLQGLLGL